MWGSVICRPIALICCAGRYSAAPFRLSNCQMGRRYVLTLATGFAIPAFDMATEPFAELTRSLGIALLTISHSYSAGVLGWMSERLAQLGLVSLGFANSSPLVAPWGGSIRKLGTNPLAFGVPRGSAAPFVFDMATSATAYLNVVRAADAGQQIPLGWALDMEGQPTTDARHGVTGSVAPLGGAKGFGLGLIVEILAGGLSGGSWAIEASSLVDDVGGPPNIGQTFIAIDPMRREAGFSQRIERLFAVMIEETAYGYPEIAV